MRTHYCQGGGRSKDRQAVRIPRNRAVSRQTVYAHRANGHVLRGDRPHDVAEGSAAEANLAQLDIAGMALGGSSLAKKGTMKINKSGTKSDHGDGSGPKGFLHGNGDNPDNPAAVIKDGKFKTNAALSPPSLSELGELIAKTVGKMTEGAAASVPWRIRYMQLPNGGNVPVIMKIDNHGSSGNSKHSKRESEGTGKVKISIGNEKKFKEHYR